MEDTLNLRDQNLDS